MKDKEMNIIPKNDIERAIAYTFMFCFIAGCIFELNNVGTYRQADSLGLIKY